MMRGVGEPSRGELMIFLLKFNSVWPVGHFWDHPGAFPLCQISPCNPYFDRLVQERRNSSALAMELCLSCTMPSI